MAKLKSAKVKAIEALAQGLTILTFIVLCFVADRALRVRHECVSSSFIAYVRMDGRRVDNCLFESRLNLKSLTASLNDNQYAELRALEVLEPMTGLFGAGQPRLTIEINRQDPQDFEIGWGALRLGADWLRNPLQLRRALVMAVLKNQTPHAFANQFQLETVTDFVMYVVYGQPLPVNVKFPTAAPTFADYCRSPQVSLAHAKVCHMAAPDSSDLQDRVWGFRALLASGLYRVFEKLPLKEQVEVVRGLRRGVELPIIESLPQTNVASLVAWFDSTLMSYARALSMDHGDGDEFAIRRALKELEVEAPTHWELTFDLTHTPAWREIVKQLIERARFHLRERSLIFTPAGEVALPSGLPVDWSAQDIRSQKHVLIACKWPKPNEAVRVKARQLFAQHSCGKLTSPFWD